MMRPLHIATLLIFSLSAFVSAETKKATVSVPEVKPKELSLVRVNVTGQPYDFVRPWQKKAPFSKRALGAVLPQGRVLVTADLVANQNYVELERAESGEKTAANVVVVQNWTTELPPRTNEIICSARALSRGLFSF